MHCKQNLQGLLTICRKAGKLQLGLTPVTEHLQQGQVSGVMVCQDTASKSKKEARFQCRRQGVPCIELPFTKEEMGWVIGRACGVIAVCDDGFFRRFQELVTQTEE